MYLQAAAQSRGYSINGSSWSVSYRNRASHARFFDSLLSASILVILISAAQFELGVDILLITTHSKPF